MKIYQHLITCNMEPKVITPSIPAIIKVEIGGQSVPIEISKFSDDELKTIGENWTKELLIKAKRLRQNNY